MDIDGSFSFGDLPDDSDASGDEEAPHRGWIAPEDRLWRHPSEVALPARASTSRASSGRELWRERRGPIAAGAIGAAAIAAAAAVVLALANVPVGEDASGHVHATDTSLAVPDGIAHATSSLRRSLVELQPADAARRIMTGVVLPGGDLIVTSAFAAAGTRRMEVTTYSGKHLRATVLASDPSSGVAVIKTDEHLRGASFNGGLVAPGELALAACMHAGSSSSTAKPKADVVEATVETVGHAIPSTDGNGLLDTIEAQTPMRASGGVLIDTNGAVIGLLNRQEASAGGTIGLFVPATLVLDVAGELSSVRHIEHGWIGVADSDAPNDSGAEIDGVFSGSPAATAGLEPGDVVIAVDGQVVLTHADLEASLYTVPPGRKVDLTVERHGSVMTVPVIPAAA